jgi:hypothetical protein
MSNLCDLDHLFGSDLNVTAAGDIAVVSNHNLTVERVIRRLMTAQTSLAGSAYPWQPTYGAGLPQKIGNAINQKEVQAIVLSQLLQESSVSPTPLPTVGVTVTPGTGVVVLNVMYTDLSGTPQSFGFEFA